MRGVAFQDGRHDFVIHTGGLELYPRLSANTTLRTTHDGSAESGSSQLDALLGGGLDRGSSTLLLGPAGCGKTTVGIELAARLGCGFVDADDYHSPENRARMNAGIALTDDPRRLWLETLANWIFTRWFGSRKLKFANGIRSKPDVRFMKDLIEAGSYRPVVDRTYPMEQVVDAHRYVETWHKRGNVVLTM